MLFYFDIEDGELSRIDIALLEERVSMLMRAHRDGRHLVVLSRRTSNWLINSEIRMGGNDFATLKTLGSQVTQNGNLRQYAPFFIKLSPPGVSVGIVRDNEINVPLDFPFFEQLLMKAVLVVENIENDNELLRVIFNGISSSYCWNFIAYEPTHAGGSSGVPVSKSYINQHRIVFTVLDSDRRAPNYNSTAFSKLKSLSGRSSWPLFFFDVWPCLELENILTLPVLETLQSPDSRVCLDHLRMMHEVDRLSHVNPAEQYQYFFDMKEGLRASKIIKLTDEVVIKWLNEKMAKAGLELNALDIPGFGENLISQFSKCHRAQQQFHSVIWSDPLELVLH